MKLEIYYEQHEKLFNEILSRPDSHYNKFFGVQSTYDIFKNDDIYNSNYRKEIAKVVVKDVLSYTQSIGFTFDAEIISSLNPQQFWNGVALSGKAKELVYFKLKYL